ncbi:MAG: hypothetical protein MZV64_49035 [Ignavibacteriales bacterium]|nr:hypothetical protein [Ignavibacteriales bacterium]
MTRMPQAIQTMKKNGVQIIEVANPKMLTRFCCYGKESPQVVGGQAVRSGLPEPCGEEYCRLPGSPAWWQEMKHILAIDRGLAKRRPCCW